LLNILSVPHFRSAIVCLPGIVANDVAAEWGTVPFRTDTHLTAAQPPT